MLGGDTGERTRMNDLSASATARTRARPHSHPGADNGPDELVDLLSMPGYLIRRSKQISTGAFMEACRDIAVTPVQFAAMSIVNASPGLDQSELGAWAGLDPSTTGEVIQRLEKRGLLTRAGDGNRRLCALTADGRALFERLRPVIAAAQARILSPLTARERTQLLRLLSKLNGVSNRHFAARSHQRLRRRMVATNALTADEPAPAERDIHER